MTEQDARIVLFLKAVEQHDPPGSLLPHPDRAHASRTAAAFHQAHPDKSTGPAGQDFLARRAQILRQQLAPRYPAVNLALASGGNQRALIMAVVFVALLAGFATAALPANQRINILAFPLLGMLLWNVGVYVFLVAGKLRFRSSSQPGFLVRLLTLSHARPQLRTASSEPEAAHRQWRQILRAYYADWSSTGRKLHLLRAQIALHLGAAALAAGAIGGMYLRGLAMEYRATWESTFLNEHQVEQIIRLVLGPASFLTGIDLPGAAELARLRGPQALGENATDWIHLYAATALLFIVLPRAFLALTAWKTARGLRADFPLSTEHDPYYRRLLAAGQASPAESVWVVSYSFELASREQEVLSAFLGDFVCPLALVKNLPAIPYGAEEEFIAGRSQEAGSQPEVLVVVFNLASTPEEENHGELIRRCRELVAAGKLARRLLFFLEESRYRLRLAEGNAGRIEERRQAWARQARASGVILLSIDLEQPEPERWWQELESEIRDSSTKPQ